MTAPVPRSATPDFYRLVGNAVNEMLRKAPASVSVTEYGAIGDGVADDAAAIQRAIDAVIDGGTVTFPAGSYKISTALEVDADYVRLVGVGAASKLLLATAGQDGIVFGNGTSARTFCGAHDLEINVTGVAKSAGAAIRFRKVQSGFTSGLRIANQFLGWQITDSVLIYSTNDTLLNPVATGGGVLCETTGSASNDHYFDNLFMQGVQASQPVFGYKITGATGVWIRGGGTLYMGDGLVVDAANGVTIENVFCYGWAAFDQGSGNGIRLNAQAGGTIRTVRIDQGWACSNGDEGILQAGAGTISNVRYTNVEAKNNGKEGLKVEAGTNFRIDGGQYESNGTLAATTYSGIYVAANLTGFSIRNTVSTGAGQDYGLEIAAGTSDYYHIIGNDFRTNGTGSFSDGGSGVNKHVDLNLP